MSLASEQPSARNIGRHRVVSGQPRTVGLLVGGVPRSDAHQIGPSYVPLPHDWFGDMPAGVPSVLDLFLDEPEIGVGAQSADVMPVTPRRSARRPHHNTGGDMAATASSTHLPALEAPARCEAGRALQATLVELTDLALVGKQLHWSVVGPFFRPLHLYLDELVGSWRDLADMVAERAIAIDVWPDGQANAVVTGRDSDELAPGPIADYAVARELSRRVAAVAELTRARMDRIGELDMASQDVLTDVVRTLEEHLWMLRAQIPTRR